MLQTHQRLGDFEIIRRIGYGGMGEVYEAQQSNPSRRVALKVLAPWLADDDQALERFWREAAVPAQLDHPNIVRIISTGKTADGIAYYTMQLVRGVSLSEMIKRARNPARPAPAAGQATIAEAEGRNETPSVSQPIVVDEDVTPPTESVMPTIVTEYCADRFAVTARLGAVAASALASAHRHGVLHRDIKPSNIMVDHHGHLHLVDFGLTRALIPDGELSMPGQIRGTPWYMSPEQARGLEIDERSDIYSLGVTLYELLSHGTGPYTANRQNSKAVLEQVKQGECLPLRVVAPDTPPALENIIQKAMQLRPDRRYADAAELAADLEKFERGSGSAPRSVSYAPQRSTPRLAALLKRKRLLTSVTAGALLLALLAVLAPLWNRRSEPETPFVEPRPKLLATQPAKLEFSLVNTDGQPHWHELLLGSGVFHVLPTPSHPIALQSPPSDEATMVALAEWSGKRRFTFNVEMSQHLTANMGPDEGRAGIFFGWRRDPQDTKRSCRFFVVQLEERSTNGFPDGCIRVGTALHTAADGAQGSMLEWLTALPTDNAVIPLPKKKDGRRLRVTVRDRLVTLNVDSQPAREFDLTALRHKQGSGGEGLDAAGAIGIWVGKGAAYFKNPRFAWFPDAE